MKRWALLAALVAAPASATVVVPLDLNGLVDHADRVVLGRVEAASARWSADHSAIYTEVTLRVERALTGPARAGDAIALRTEGGSVDGVGMRVYGAARFTVGEEVVAFLEQRGAATWTVGMAQGKMRVVTVGGARLAVRDVAGLGFVEGAPRPAEPATRPLDELLRLVADRVARSAR
jgi:hypothetical protein